jgi:hypothetical protein
MSLVWSPEIFFSAALIKSPITHTGVYDLVVISARIKVTYSHIGEFFVPQRAPPPSHLNTRLPILTCDIDEQAYMFPRKSWCETRKRRFRGYSEHKQT